MSLLRVDFKHSFPITIYFEDTDVGGVVYYANYLRFYERGRSEWLRAQGVTLQQFMTQQQCALVVRHVTIDYLKPAVLENVLIINTEVTSHRGSRLFFTQQITRDQQLINQATIEVVTVDPITGKSKPIPNDWFQAA